MEEADSVRADDLLAADDVPVTGRHTLVEVRRNLARLLIPPAATRAQSAVSTDVASLSLVELDADPLELAATTAEQTGVRTLDALHLGAAYRLGTCLTFLTFDLRQAAAAREVGFRVIGA